VNNSISVFFSAAQQLRGARSPKKTVCGGKGRGECCSSRGGKKRRPGARQVNQVLDNCSNQKK